MVSSGSGFAAGSCRIRVHPSWFSSGLEVTLTAGWLSLSRVYLLWLGLSLRLKPSLGGKMTQLWDRTPDSEKEDLGRKTVGRTM